ncbi:MAG: D-alanyl-D-alanine carboxypeptidase family protein [Methylocystaceae bacterium]
MKRKLSVLLLALLMVGILVPAANAAEPVKVEAKAYIIMDAASGQVLMEKEADTRLAPASMTKLMTLLLAVEAIDNGKARPYDKVVTSENAWRMGGSQIYLEPGEEMTLHDLLVSVAVGSANDACVAVAEYLEGSHEAFIEKMNLKAEQLGMKNTHFSNAYGLPAPEHYTSCRDMAILGRYCLRYPQILEYTAIKEYNLRQGKFKLFNTNKLLWWYNGADGFKTGWTNEAKYCLVSTAKRDKLRLVSVVMASPQPRGNFRDSMALYNWGFARYSFKSFFPAGAVVDTVTVGKGLDDMVEAIAVSEIGTIIEKGSKSKITYKKQVLPYLSAPVKKGQHVGNMQVLMDGKEVCAVELVATRDIPRCSLWMQIKKTLAKTLFI